MLRTDQSFTVAAWVNLARKDRYGVAVSQDGTSRSSFYLGYDQGQDRWRLGFGDADAPSSSPVAYSVSEPEAGVWTHLAGVFDAQAGEFRLYVNGLLEGTVGWTNRWHAPGGFQIGRAKYGGAPEQFWPGAIRDVRAYTGALDEETIWALGHPESRLAGYWKLDETSGTTAADASGREQTATLSGGAAWTAGWIGNALHLDGASGYAGTSGPVLRTDQSFTVAAWVRLGDTSRWAAALSQDGTRQSGFRLEYFPDLNCWAFSMPTSDGDGASVDSALALDGAVPGEWVHLAAVYNQHGTQLLLYVNGRLAGSAPRSGAWNAGGGLQIGRAQALGTAVNYWPGDVDEVRVYQGALTAAEIQDLYELTG